MKKFGYSFSVIILALALSGCASQESSKTDNRPALEAQTAQPQEKQGVSKTKTASVWEFDGEKWHSFSVAPPCPDPLVMQSPIDMSLVSGILYPGQFRGGDYKPHGGFRFDGQKSSAITVKAPLDAVLVHGSRYIEQGEIQYLLWFENACGIGYRFDHLHTLAPEIQKLVDTLPAAKPDDSRTTNFATPLEVKAGDTIATAVGFAKNQNIGVDWGVYDLRQPNAASKNPSFAAKHADKKSQAFYALCWFDLLPADLAQKVRALPASSPEAKNSDYCE